MWLVTTILDSRGVYRGCLPHPMIHCVEWIEGDGNVTRRKSQQPMAVGEPPSSSLFCVVHELRIILHFKRVVKNMHKTL